jgi:hypothetical protein
MATSAARPHQEKCKAVRSSAYWSKDNSAVKARSCLLRREWNTCCIT